MKQNQQQNRNNNSQSSGSNPQKVKRDIKQDVNAGQGAMTSREAGAMRD
ncbi:hypothetical protein [Neobacillus notoginsengisoli]|nr:hypothetical protein [Neobacillus notoginsengisoli]